MSEPSVPPSPEPNPQDTKQVGPGSGQALSAAGDKATQAAGPAGERAARAPASAGQQPRRGRAPVSTSHHAAPSPAPAPAPERVEVAGAEGGPAPRAPESGVAVAEAERPGDEEYVVYRPRLTIADGFRFGCGFVAAVMVFNLAVLIVLTLLYLIAVVLRFPLPGVPS